MYQSEAYAKSYDWVAVEAAMKGRKVHLHEAERRELIRRARAGQITRNELSRMLNLSGESAAKLMSGEVEYVGERV